MLENPWAKRAEAYFRIFREICEIRDWTCDKEHFQKFGRYVGMAATLFALASTSAAAESESDRLVLSVDTNETTYISAIETVIKTSQLVTGKTVYQIKSGACFEEHRELVSMKSSDGIEVPEVYVSSEPVACPGSRR